MSFRNGLGCTGVIGVFGLVIVGSFIFYNVMENSEEGVKRRAEFELQQQRQAEQERITRGIEACNRAANPKPAARAPRGAKESIEDITHTLNTMSADMDVSALEHQMDEATLAGDSELVNKLRGDLNVARRAAALKHAEERRREFAAEAHEQALKDIADCRKFRGER
jgi:hypothetical protein